MEFKTKVYLPLTYFEAKSVINGLGVPPFHKFLKDCLFGNKFEQLLFKGDFKSTDL